MAAGAVPVCLCGGSEEKIAPAEKDLPAGLCPLIKSHTVISARRQIRSWRWPISLWRKPPVTEKKKMYELMGLRKEMYILELPQKPDDPHAKEHWLWELRKFRDFLQQKFKKEITPNDLRSAIEIMNQERRLRRQIARMNTQSVPVWSGRQLLNFKSIISGIRDDFEEYQRLFENGNKASVHKNPSKVRILLTGVPTVHGAEKVVDIIENAGGAVVCMENCTGLKPIIEDVSLNSSDPLESIAEKYFHLPCSVMTQNSQRHGFTAKTGDGLSGGLYY